MDFSSVQPLGASYQPDVSVSPNLVHGTPLQLKIWIVLNMWPSHIGIPILLATILFSKHIQRHATFINFLIVWIVTGVASSLLVYAGKTTGPEPDKTLCLLQSSLLYGFPMMTSSSAFILVLQMFLTIKGAMLGQNIQQKKHSLRLWAMIVTPYAGLLLSVVVTIILGVIHPDRVSRSRRFFYCSLENLEFTNFFAIISAIFLFFTLMLEVRTICIIYRHWDAIGPQSPGVKWPMEFSLSIRIMTFGLYVVIAMSLSLISIASPTSPIPDLIIATASSVVFVIFGSQRDILQAWCFWRYLSSRQRGSVYLVSPVQENGTPWKRPDLEFAVGVPSKNKPLPSIPVIADNEVPVIDIIRLK